MIEMNHSSDPTFEINMTEIRKEHKAAASQHVISREVDIFTGIVIIAMIVLAVPGNGLIIYAFGR